MREERSNLVYSTDGSSTKEKNPGKPGRENKTSAEGGPSSGQKQKQKEKQKLHLRLERKGRGGKTVTLVCGLSSIASKDMPGNGITSLLKEMKARLGTGGAVKDGVLELQGDHRDAITALLREKGLKI